MSGTNPNIKAMAANITNEKDGRTAGGFKTAVYVGKDQRPVSIMEVVPLKTPGWKRWSMFDNFTSVMENLSETHEAADIMMTVANEVPIGTETAAAEAEEVAARVRKEVFCVGNLFGPADLDSRPQDIAYFGFQCVLDAAETVDKRIDQQPLSLHYSLKLPQAICNPSTKEVEDIFSAPGKRYREAFTKGMSSKRLSSDGRDDSILYNLSCCDWRKALAWTISDTLIRLILLLLSMLVLLALLILILLVPLFMSLSMFISQMHS